MTQAEIHTKLMELLEQTLGKVPQLIESKGPFVMKGDSLGIPTYSDFIQISDKPFASLQEALDCTSLEIVSVQMAIEEAFGLEFGTGLDRDLIDEEWDRLKSVDDLRVFIAKWIKP